MDDADDKLHAARHEAGHAVIGFYNGRHPTGMFILERDGRWIGDCRFPPGKVENSVTAMTAIAGVLAQAKSVATTNLDKPLTFDQSSESRELISFLRDSVRSDDEPGECHVTFLTMEKEKAEFRINGRWYSGSDQIQFRQAVKLMVTGNVIKYTMEDLDIDDNWNALCGLANFLLASQPNGEDRRIELDGEEIVHFLTNAGIKSGQV